MAAEKATEFGGLSENVGILFLIYGTPERTPHLQLGRAGSLRRG